jgi:tripartite-type tricarboxylate transporter receptor subunit TctC
MGFLTSVFSGAAYSAFPEQPIRLVIGYTPGGSVDAVARVIAPKLSAILGQSVVVDYRPGAAGIIGARSVAGAAPDGYTLHLVESATLVILPSLQDTGYQPETSFTPISTVASAGFVIAANPQVPAKLLPELIDLMQGSPGKYSYATSGVGSVGHVGMEMLQLDRGLKSVHVPYKGGGPAITDVIGGQVPLIISSMAPAIPQVKAGTIQAIAVTSLRRSIALPDVPTVAEQGMPGFEALAWYGLVGPAGLPSDVIQKISVATERVMKDEDVRKALELQGFEALGDSAQALTARISSDVKKWKSVIDSANITLQ